MSQVVLPLGGVSLRGWHSRGRSRSREMCEECEELAKVDRKNADEAAITLSKTNKMGMMEKQRSGGGSKHGEKSWRGRNGERENQCL